jgi:hypothetical protein
VKFLWHGKYVMTDVCHKFQDFRIDSLEAIKIKNALCCFAPILNRFERLYYLAQLSFESCLDDNKKVIDNYLTLLVLNLQDLKLDSLGVT